MKVYFNNSCKICKAEIDIYKKQEIQEIDWVDITNNISAEKETLKSDKELLRRLHIKDNEKVFEGAEAFLLLWKRMPKYRFLYNFFKLPIVFNIFSIVYIEYNAVSLVEYRKYSVECGPLLEILSNNIDFSTNPLLSMNRTSCRNMAIVTLINTFISIIFLTFLLVLVVRLIKNKTENTRAA